MKKVLTIGALVISLALIPTAKILADDSAAQGVQKAFTAVKDSLDNLVTAKDENDPNDINLRVETFKKVIELAISESKNLKIKLLSLDQIENGNIATWQNSMLESLNKALTYYNDEKQVVNQVEINNMVTIQNMAMAFKDWRSQNYLPLADQIGVFLLIQQEKTAVTTAEARAQKINGDILKLQKTTAKNLNSIKKVFDNAVILINEGKKLNGEASDAFIANYIGSSSVANNDNLPSTGTVMTQNNATSADQNNVLAPMAISADVTSSTQNASSSVTDSSSTEVSPPPPLSIKDLIKASLDKIKDAYQVFIEMSSSVRKLLS